MMYIPLDKIGRTIVAHSMFNILVINKFVQLLTIIDNYLRINTHISLFHFLCNKALGQCIAIAIGRCVNRISYFCATKLPILQVIV